MSKKNGAVQVEGIEDGSGAGKQRRADLALAMQIAGGDEESFKQLYELYQGRVFGYVIKKVGNPSDVEDICQEVFLHVYRSIASYKGQSTLGGWILGIAHHKICDLYRGRPVTALSLDDTGVQRVATAEPGQDRVVDAAREYDDCCRQLKEHIRDIPRQYFELHHGKGYTARRIAVKFGKSTQAVKVSLLRTRSRLAHGKGSDRYCGLGA